MICVSVANIEFLELKALISDFEMLELRLDLLNYSKKEYQYIYQLNKPVIATFRKNTTATDKQRIEHLKNAIEEGAQFIDIDIENKPDFINTIKDFAQFNNCKIILSYHNYTRTPSLKQLNTILSRAKSLKPDFIKIVTTAQNQSDITKIVSLYENNDNLIAFNMGEMGKISRLVSLYLGAPFTYASVSKQKATAEGQLTYIDLKKLQEILK